MKILSLFTKAPQHQRFKYNPRFYDPVKEELKEREDRIQSEIERARGEVRQESGDYKSRIAGSFQAARKGSKPGSDTSATMIRLSILVISYSTYCSLSGVGPARVLFTFSVCSFLFLSQV
jgi:hypothetical protein